MVLWSKPWKSSSFQLIYFAFMNLRVFQGGWHFTHLKKPGMWQGKGRRSKSKGLAVFQMQCIFLLFFSTRNLRGFWHFNSVQNHSSKKMCTASMSKKQTHARALGHTHATNIPICCSSKWIFLWVYLLDVCV